MNSPLHSRLVYMDVPDGLHLLGRWLALVTPRKWGLRLDLGSMFLVEVPQEYGISLSLVFQSQPSLSFTWDLWRAQEYQH